jgi:hypothetical protein
VFQYRKVKLIDQRKLCFNFKLINEKLLVSELLKNRFRIKLQKILNINDLNLEFCVFKKIRKTTTKRKEFRIFYRKKSAIRFLFLSSKARMATRSAFDVLMSARIKPQPKRKPVEKNQNQQPQATNKVLSMISYETNDHPKKDKTEVFKRPKAQEKQLSDQTKQRDVSDQKFQCNICLRVFKREFFLLLHMKTHAKKYFFCDLCDYKNFSFSYLKTHLETHISK